MSSSAVQYFILCGELQNEVRMALRGRLASASGIQLKSLTRVLGRRSPAPSSPLALPAAVGRPESTPRRILLATPDAETPSGVRMAPQDPFDFGIIHSTIMARSPTYLDTYITENDQQSRPTVPRRTSMANRRDSIPRSARADRPSYGLLILRRRAKPPPTALDWLIGFISFLVVCLATVKSNMSHRAVRA
jgi:hypothetical protein